MPYEKHMSHYEWRRSKEDYLKNPSYVHPVYGTPLQEPYKPSDKPGVVTYRGVPIKLNRKPPDKEPDAGSEQTTEHPSRTNL
jgi:hypothetical protein